MSLNFNDINISVNSQNIMCESISLDQQSPQKPAYILNSSRPLDNIPQGLKHSLNMSYYLEPGNEPNYAIITGWKNDVTGNLKATLNLGRIQFTGYLSNYSFNLTPNNAVMAQATYQIYEPLTGNFYQSNSTGDSLLYNLQNSDGIAHYWSAEMTSGDYVTIPNNNIIQLDFSWNSSIIPHYKLGNSLPCQISCVEANEEINLTNEIQNNPTFLEQSYDIIFNDIDNIRLKDMSSINHIDFCLSGFVAQTNKANIAVNQMIVYSHNLSKSY